MPNDYWRDQKSWPVSQTAVSWLIVILFAAFFGGWWPWLIKEAQNHRERASQIILPNDQRYQQTLQEIDSDTWKWSWSNSILFRPDKPVP